MELFLHDRDDDNIHRALRLAPMMLKCSFCIIFEYLILKSINERVIVLIDLWNINSNKYSTRVLFE